MKISPKQEVWLMHRSCGVFQQRVELSHQGEKEALRHFNAKIACCSRCKGGRRHIPACCRTENDWFWIHGAWSSYIKLFLELVLLVLLKVACVMTSVFRGVPKSHPGLSLSLVCAAAPKAFAFQGFCLSCQHQGVTHAFCPGRSTQLSWVHTGTFPFGFSSRGTGSIQAVPCAENESKCPALCGQRQCQDDVATKFCSFLRLLEEVHSDKCRWQPFSGTFCAGHKLQPVCSCVTAQHILCFNPSWQLPLNVSPQVGRGENQKKIASKQINKTQKFVWVEIRKF